jgi:hypothetical protein
MSRWFNTAGPCQSEINYMLSPSQRLPNLLRLISQRNYFVIHAPRQIGKTTAMMRLAEELTQSGQYAAVVVSVEVGSPFSDDPGQAELAILGAWRDTIAIRLPQQLRPPTWVYAEAGQRIRANLQAWAQVCPLPLVVLIDEIDSLQNQALISFLRQLRDGYPNRPQNFPMSIGLIGMRDVRDYKIASGGSGRLNTASPFNIKVRSLTMRNFNLTEVGELYQQYTEETGQVFTKEAVETAFYLTQGQPWLVNAIAKEIVEEILTDTDIAITPEYIHQASEVLILRQDTHLDSLAERLREPRVKAIIEPMLVGKTPRETSSDDRQYLIDLGLLRRYPDSGLTIANPIYREVIPRVLSEGPQDSLPYIYPSWLSDNGELDIDALLEAFIEFWCQHGEPLLGTTSYHEIAPHLVLMAFLHRVINGGGSLEREYAIGRGRMDLCLKYKSVTLGIEIKVWNEKTKDPEEKGLKQLDEYLSGIKVNIGWLLIFDKREKALVFSERLATKNVTTETGRSITVIRA